MTTEAKIFKIILYVSSLLLMVGAFVMVFSMVALMVKGKEYVDLMGNNSSWIIACAVVAVAVFMVFIAALGCLGAAGKNTCLLKLYIILVSVLMVTLVASGIVAWAYKSDALDHVEESMKSKMATYRPGTTDDDTVVWDVIQKKFKCCGINSHRDWSDIHASYNTAYKRTPDSCKEDSSSSSSQIFVDGCLLKVSESIRQNHWSIGGAIAGVFLYLLLSICIVCMVIKSINDDEPLLFKGSSSKGLDNAGMQVRA